MIFNISSHYKSTNMYIPFLAWFILFVSFMTTMSYTYDHINYDDLIVICIGFSMTYFMACGIYRIVKMFKYGISFDDLIMTLFMLSFSFISCHLYFALYFDNESISTQVLFIVCSILGLTVNIERYISLIQQNR